MALFEEGILGSIAEGIGSLSLGALAMVAGAVVFGPALLAAIGRAVRPLAKETIKTGMRVYDHGRAAAARTAEAAGDVAVKTTRAARDVAVEGAEAAGDVAVGTAEAARAIMTGESGNGHNGEDNPIYSAESDVRFTDMVSILRIVPHCTDPAAKAAGNGVHHDP